MTLKEQAIKNLLDLKHVTTLMGIRFSLMDGTLLGAIRDKDIIKGDEDDIDIAFLTHDYVGVTKALVPELEKIGFKVLKEFRVFGILEGMAVERGGNHIDFLRINYKDGKAFNYGRGNGKLYAYMYDEEFFKFTQDIYFLDEKFTVPRHPEKFLEIRFIDWKTPTPRTEYNYLSKDHVPCLEVFEDTSGIKM